MTHPKRTHRKLGAALIVLIVLALYVLLPDGAIHAKQAHASTGACTYPTNYYYGYGVVRRSHPAFLGHTVRVAEVECITAYGPGGLLYTSTPSITYPTTSVAGAVETLSTASTVRVVYHTSYKVIYEWQVHQSAYKGLIQQDFVAHLYVYRSSGKLCISGYCQTFWFRLDGR